MGNSGFLYVMVAMELDGASDSVVMANGTSDNTALRAGQTAQGIGAQTVITA